jgi:hypothetical protein
MNIFIEFSKFFQFSLFEHPNIKEKVAFYSGMYGK